MGLGGIPPSPGWAFPLSSLLGYGFHCLQVRGHKLLFLLVWQNICSYLEARMFAYLMSGGENEVPTIVTFNLLFQSDPRRTSQVMCLWPGLVPGASSWGSGELGAPLPPRSVMGQLHFHLLFLSKRSNRFDQSHSGTLSREMGRKSCQAERRV